MKKEKYRGRKKYTSKEAGNQMENIMQMMTTFQECVNYWRKQPRTRSDKLIEALCNQTREEMIEETEDKIEYCESKFKYMKQFNPDYKIKGSFGIR